MQSKTSFQKLITVPVIFLTTTNIWGIWWWFIRWRRAIFVRPFGAAIIIICQVAFICWFVIQNFAENSALDPLRCSLNSLVMSLSRHLYTCYEYESLQKLDYTWKEIIFISELIFDTKLNFIHYVLHLWPLVQQRQIHDALVLSDNIRRDEKWQQVTSKGSSMKKNVVSLTYQILAFKKI